MAKPISFTKRDLEKKKQEKRLAKQQKKEERKNNGTSSFEDMIAYVDENEYDNRYSISNNKPQEVDMSTIEVSTPRRTEEPIELVHEGENRALQCIQRIWICKRFEECREILLSY